MKIYYHPASTTSRPLMHFAADSGLQAEFQVVDLFTGEHMGEAYTEVNPNQLVPTLEDGDFRLTESSTILKYLADSIDSPAYPKELKQRARVNEMMDWINTQLCRDFAYGTRLSADLSAPQASDRRGTAGAPSPGARSARSAG